MIGVPRNRLLDAAWVLATNLLLLAGVVAWGWPPGNVFLLFWAENVILGVITVVRILTARGVPAEPVGDRSVERWPPWGQALFFSFHYGLFALVHLGFVTVVAMRTGVEWGFWMLGFPILLVALRYVVDLATVWFLGGRRDTVSPGQAFAWPYPRLIVLHLATLIGFLFTMQSFGGGRSRWDEVLAPLRTAFDGLGFELSDGAVLVAVLMLLKTVFELGALMVAGRRGDNPGVRREVATGGS